MICEVAVATNTVPGQWMNEDPRSVITVVDILTQQAKAMRKAGK